MTTREYRMKIFPTSLKKTYEKSIKSKAFAIKAFCAECCQSAKDWGSICSAWSVRTMSDVYWQTRTGQALERRTSSTVLPSASSATGPKP